ncbi:MAG TPA: ATP-dependent Clp protease adaptor ClpS [Nitrospinaceae bacterium]|jgi:ATP-dependent Clp protease adaptor protein ClpS|nr:ATP-dependent Clp protease adaptor ClpS [Nitrospinaceae bacterium]
MTEAVDRKKSKKKIRKLSPPRDYKVILHNDDFTPMEFVTWILETVFHKNTPEAESIMLDVHKKGKGVAGVYTHEIAEQKVWDTLESAKENQFPLQCSAEPV